MKGEEERGNGRNPSLDISGSVPKRPVRPSLGPDGTDGSTWKGARDGRVSWRPSRRQSGADRRGLQVSQVAQFSG